eukprot:SAG25_NODE_1212_length_3593_cov_29.084717_1_plen_138_part_00
MRNDGHRDLKAVPAWESDVGFLEAVEAVCSEAVLGQFGMRPMKPNARGEAQWQLVHVSSSKYTGQDSGYRGYKQLQPSPLGSSDSSSSSSRAGLEPAHDVLVCHSAVLRRLILPREPFRLTLLCLPPVCRVCATNPA